MTGAGSKIARGWEPADDDTLKMSNWGDFMPNIVYCVHSTKADTPTAADWQCPERHCHDGTQIPTLDLILCLALSTYPHLRLLLAPHSSCGLPQPTPPTSMANHLQVVEHHLLEKSRALIACQLLCPISMQYISTPMHLLGMPPCAGPQANC